MSELTPKRGRAVIFPGENWKLAGDKKWTELKLYVPSGQEKLMGSRMIRGVEHTVFRCLDDDFLAQPTEICALPKPEDDLEILSP